MVAQLLWRGTAELEVAGSIRAVAAAFQWGQSARMLVYCALGLRERIPSGQNSELSFYDGTS